MSDISNIVEELVQKRFRDLVVSLVGGDAYDRFDNLKTRMHDLVMKTIDEEIQRWSPEIKAAAIQAFTKWYEGVEPQLYDHHQIIFKNKKADNIACVPKE